jgi:hypothetical protein
MSETKGASDNDAIRRALQLVTEALDVLDGGAGAPNAAAHLSLAQEELRQALRRET